MNYQKEFDLEVSLFIESFKLVEETNKVYSSGEIPFNLVYVFQNEEEFIRYFIQSGLEKINLFSLNSYKLKTTSKGKVLALKKLCDYMIRKAYEKDDFSFDENGRVKKLIRE